MFKIPRRLLAATAAATVILPLTMTTTATTASAAEPHADNPYAGATQYVNPTWAASVEGAATRVSDPALAAKMRVVKNQPTAVWIDRISAIAGNSAGPGLRSHLDNALLQKQSGTPLVVNLVIYDLPGRDCYALASNGELPATAAGLTRYKTEYIDPIAAILADTKYQGLRIAATIEPDSLPNLVTNSSQPECQQAAPFYRDGVKYALDKLHAIPNVYNYIDAAHSGWLGWDNNAVPAAQLFAEVARSTQAGLASVDGFVTNTANTTPLNEPYLPDSSLTLNGTPIRSSSYYEWNFDFDELDWTAHLHTLLVAQGFPAGIGMLVDTSRNGWGGAARPTATSTSTDLNTYVDQSRVDRRNHRGAWCNPLGAGIGERPQATPAAPAASHLDAFVWIKPPGESDGASTDIPNDEGKRFDRMCDPTFVSPKLGNRLTGASPGAPLAGHWFESQFVELVRNAFPVINGGGNPPADQTSPSVPTALRAGTITDTSVALTWTPSTDNVAVTGYDVYRGTTLAGSSSTASFTATGLTANTAYSFTVRAKDAAGNVSAASAALSATTTGTTNPPQGSCKVKYSANTWNTGFTASIKLTNTSTSPLSNWRLTFAFANGQTVQQGWSAVWSQAGSVVTATAIPGQGTETLAPGASVDIGFNGAHSGTNNAPTAFSVSGQPCTIG
ncbi:glycoside hydrolase family 6 protein [Kribbella sp. NPDC006257]|uniref:glycoside hydrolase family 6 protein n=1 Tax=Kribbella sp. NPDC006257 TaxID=3156738 RepID=UPI0033BE4FD4